MCGTLDSLVFSNLVLHESTSSLASLLRLATCFEQVLFFVSCEQSAKRGEKRKKKGGDFFKQEFGNFYVETPYYLVLYHGTGVQSELN